MSRRTPRSTRTDTLFPYPTRFRSAIAAFLGGAGREVEIADAGAGKTLELEVIVPVEDLANLSDGADDDAGPEKRHSIWPNIYPALLDRKSTRLNSSH